MDSGGFEAEDSGMVVDALEDMAGTSEALVRDDQATLVYDSNFPKKLTVCLNLGKVSVWDWVWVSEDSATATDTA